MAGSPKKAMWVVGLLLPGAGVFGLMGCNSEPVSSGQRTSTLGEPLDEPLPQQTVGSHTDDSVGTTLAVEGEIVQQCPAAGCWFRVKDKTGELFVDLKPAGLRLTESRVGQRVQVTGRVEKTGKRYQLQARFVEFEPVSRPVASEAGHAEAPPPSRRASSSD